MSTVFAYRRPAARNAATDFKAQEQSIRLIAQLQGLRISDSGWKEEIGAETEVTVKYLLEAARAGDSIVFAAPSVLSIVPPG